MSHDERIKLLRAAANPSWPRVPDQLRLQLRREFDRKKNQLFNVSEQECGACFEAYTAERHHIVPLAFGGINEVINFIGICLNCHNAIHPWMKDKEKNG